MKVFYCDGSTRGGKNQKGADNIGGWGAVCLDEEENYMFQYEYDSEENTTNNRQELKALLWCLEYADEHFSDEFCVIYSDSAYVVNMFTNWIHTWAANGWKNSKKQTVENLDLVLDIWEYAKQDFYHCHVKKTDGHSGIIGNELADALATGRLKRFEELYQSAYITLDSEAEKFYLKTTWSE